MTENLFGKTMTKVTRIALFSLFASLAVADDVQEQSVAALAELLAGKFDTHAEHVQTTLPLEERFIDSRVRLELPHLGKYVFYQQLKRGADSSIYRQRIVILDNDEQMATIVQRTYSIKDPERFLDASAGDAVFADLRFDSLTPLAGEGCEQVWTLTDSGYVGVVDPARCIIISSRTGKPRGIEAVNVLTTDGLSLVERGFDTGGVQVFGTPPGDSLQLFRSRP